MKRCVVVAAVLLVFLSVGCSLVRKDQPADVIGTWTGDGYLSDVGVTKIWHMTMTLNEDQTMTLLYEADGKTVSFKGRYIIDQTRHPATIDFIDFGFSTSKLTYSFRALADFPKRNRMYFYGVMGQVGQVSFPKKIIKKPTNHHELYCDLTKSE